MTTFKDIYPGFGTEEEFLKSIKIQLNNIKFDLNSAVLERETIKHSKLLSAMHELKLDYFYNETGLTANDITLQMLIYFVIINNQ